MHVDENNSVLIENMNLLVRNQKATAAFNNGTYLCHLEAKPKAITIAQSFNTYTSIIQTLHK